MIPVVEEKREEIEKLCVRYGVRRLELFGSAAAGGFDPDRSDLDFLVEFQDLQLDRYADSYFGLLFGLEDLFGRHVDLVMASAIRNPFLRTPRSRGRCSLRRHRSRLGRSRFAPSRANFADGI